jgi:hypothetical protein
MQTLRLRRFTLHVLFAWLLALGTGFANACVIQEEVRQSAHSMMHGHEAPASHAGVDCGAGHDHTAHAGNAPCEKLLGDRSVLPNQAKQQSHAATDFWQAPAPGAFLVFLPAPEALGTAKAEPERPRPGIPIPIAFLRLTL